jgi:hypothetical protein
MLFCLPFTTSDHRNVCISSIHHIRPICNLHVCLVFAVGVVKLQRLPGERIMKLAEELYQAGFISYPRTETDRFDPAYDLPVS